MKHFSAQTIWKYMRLFVVLALALSAARPEAWQSARAQGDPTLLVDRYGHSAEGYNWPGGAELLLTVEDLETPVSPDYIASTTGGGSGYDWFNLEGVDLHPGVVVTLKDNFTTKQVILGALDVVFPQKGQSLVNGVADHNSQIEVEYWEFMISTIRRVISGNDGAWQVDFSMPGAGPDEQDLVAQLTPHSYGRVCQVDAEGDRDCHFFHILNPHLTAFVWANTVYAQEWIPGTTLTLSVDDPTNGVSPDYTATQIARPYNWDPHVTQNGFFLAQALNLRAGMILTMSDDVTTKTLIISDLTFTDMDVEANTLGGSAEDGSWLFVAVQDNFGNEASRDVQAGPGGAWHADFSLAGPGEEIFDLQPDTSVTVGQSDLDNDNTHLRLPSNAGQYAPRRISVNMTQNRVVGADWPVGANVTLIVDDPTTPAPTDYEATDIPYPEDYDPSRSRVEFTVGNGITLRPGMELTLTDGVDIRSLILHNLGIRGVNSLIDTVSGFATPYSGVWVVVYMGEMDWLRFDYADENGDWSVDFSQPGPYPDMQRPLDLVAEMDIRAFQYDEDGDITRPSWRKPILSVDLLNNTVSGNRWTNGSTVTLTVGDSDTPESPILQMPQTVHTLWPQRVLFNLTGLIDLQPGQVVTLSDGLASRTLTLDNLMVSQVDTADDTLAGIAPPDTEVCLYRRDDETYELCVPADANGNWSADLGFDLQPGDTGDAGLYGASGNVWVTWYAGWNSTDPETVVFAATSPFDLEVTGYEVGENYIARAQLFEGLLRSGVGEEFELAAASAYSLSPDGRVYTFTLRPDAYWSDGVPVTAQHFVDGILRMLDPQFASYFGQLLFPIQGAQDYYEGAISDPSLVGVEALAPDTLKITLSQPAAHFLQVLATPLVLPMRQDLIDLYGADWQAAGHFQGNGPYQLVERDGAHLLLAPNPYYHSPQQVTFESVAFSYIPVVMDQLHAYRDGDVDVILNAGTRLYRIIQADPALLADLHTEASADVDFLGLRVQKAPLDNLLVRQALAHATDRQALLAVAPQGDLANQVALGIIPPPIEGYQGNAVGLPYEPDTAQQLLAAAGYPNGDGFPEIELMGNTQAYPFLETVAAGWRSVLNIPVRVTTYRNRNQVLNSCMNEPTSCTTNAYFAGWVPDYADGYNYLNDLFHPDSGANKIGWDNPRYRELMGLIPVESDPAQRLAYMNEAERLLVQDEAAVIPLYFSDQAILARPDVYPYLELAYSPGYLIHWGDSDQDGDGLPDIIDPCPADPLDACDPAGSDAGVYGPDGGALTTEDGAAELDIPAEALDERITFTLVEAGDGYVLDTDLGQALVAVSYDIGPGGTTFAVPATITLHWADADGDGVVDGTDLLENELYVFKDGVAISQVCSLDPGCDRTANTFSVQVSSLSRFALGVITAAPPVIDAIHGPIDPQPVGTAVVVSADVRNLGDNPTFTWEWGDGASSITTLPGATHVYSQAGLYTLRLTVSQSGGLVSADYEYIVIYDPTGGFVTGGGWIPAGEGKASFGFNARYKKDSTIPEGSTEFQLEEAGLRLRSTAYDWLIVAANDSWAIYSGSGLLNGGAAPNGLPYRFMVWAMNGDPSGQPDALRIKIWLVDASGLAQVVFDNGAPQALGGGSIVVHQAK